MSGPLYRKYKTKNLDGYRHGGQMVITREWLDSCRTPQGGFREAQMKFLLERGISQREDGAFAKGWYSSAVGEEITDEEAAEFRRLANVVPGKKKGCPRENTDAAVTEILLTLGRFPDAARKEAARRILGITEGKK